MGITIPSNPKLTAGNILCVSSIEIVVLLIVANNYLPDSITESLNYLGIVAAGALCIGAGLRNVGKQEQRADFNIALQQKLTHGIPSEAGIVSSPIQSANTTSEFYGGDTSSGFVTCSACGKQNDANNAFCNNCGTRLH